MAKGVTRIDGIEKVLRRANKEIEQVESKSLSGLYAAGLKIQRDSQGLVPVDTANLKGSAYTQREDKGVVIGYGAEYAAAVHEDMEARHTVGQAKYLEQAVRQNERAIVDIVRRFAGVGT